MKRFFSTLVATITLIGIAAPAQAATANLMRCDSGSSVTGRFIYIDTYDHGGQHFQRAFTSYCPYTGEVL